MVVVHANEHPAALRIGKAAYPLKVFVVPRFLELYVLTFVGIYFSHNCNVYWICKIIKDTFPKVHPKEKRMQLCQQPPKFDDIVFHIAAALLINICYPENL